MRSSSSARARSRWQTSQRHIRQLASNLEDSRPAAPRRPDLGRLNSQRRIGSLHPSPGTHAAAASRQGPGLGNWFAATLGLLAPAPETYATSPTPDQVAEFTRCTPSRGHGCRRPSSGAWVSAVEFATAYRVARARSRDAWLPSPEPGAGCDSEIRNGVPAARARARGGASAAFSRWRLFYAAVFHVEQAIWSTEQMGL
jgi:hypothetical protein